MADLNYWKEAVDNALADAGVEATIEQRNTMASYLVIFADQEREFSGEYNIPNPLTQEVKQLRAALKNEQEKVGCKECRGRGYFVENYGTRSSETTCSRCNGEGKHLP